MTLDVVRGESRNRAFGRQQHVGHVFHDEHARLQGAQHPHILEVHLIPGVVQDAGSDLAVTLTRGSAEEKVNLPLLHAREPL